MKRESFHSASISLDLPTSRYLRDLERKAKTLDSQCLPPYSHADKQSADILPKENTGQQATPRAPIESGINNLDEEEDDDFEDAEPLFESFTHLRLNRPSTSTYEAETESSVHIRSFG